MRQARMATMVVGWFSSLVWCAAVWAQAQGTVGTTTVRGRVMNAVTKEPVARALVDVAGGGRASEAVLTDDRGQFELKILGAGPGSRWNGRRITASKPGFFPNWIEPAVTTEGGAGDSADAAASDSTISITPEALIIGHVEVPGSEGEIRIQCQLYRKQFLSGVITWAPAGSFRTWADGECRFSDLRAGTYKLITHEQMDRDSSPQIPGARLFGFPPMYYPNTTDFSAAGEMKVKAGETAQVNLRVERREYFPVRIPVRNLPLGKSVNVKVSPAGSHSPGWALGFLREEGAIGGTLPDGNYTVTAEVVGEDSMSGTVILTVKGRPAEGPVLNLVPNASVTVNVHEEFTAGGAQDSAGGLVPLTGAGAAKLEAKRRSNVHVTLAPAEELNTFRVVQPRPSFGAEAGTQVLEGVAPGAYYVHVNSAGSYAATVQSGGVDLLRQPLVVAVGGSVPPIEVSLRNDGGEVSGKVEEAPGSGISAGSAPNRFLFLLPEDAGVRDFRMDVIAPDGSFKIQQVPPGNYLLLAYEGQQDGLPYGSTEALQELEGKGVKVHVEAGEKVSVQVNVTAGSP
jgi:hypothetical protein